MNTLNIKQGTPVTLLGTDQSFYGSTFTVPAAPRQPAYRAGQVGTYVGPDDHSGAEDGWHYIAVAEEGFDSFVPVREEHFALAPTS